MSSPRSNPQPNLMDLPGEIRNRIYEYALASDIPLDLTMGDSTHKPQAVLRGTTTEFNQLKYCSRQLYHECSGLEVTYSTVTIHGEIEPEEAGPAHKFQQLLATVLAAKISRFNYIVLSVSPNAFDEPMVFVSDDDIQPVVDLCLANLHLKVDYVPIRDEEQQRTSPLEVWLVGGIFVSMLYGNEEPDLQSAKARGIRNVFVA